MRLLFLTQVLPYPLDAGPKVRAYHTLRYLAQRHEVSLLSFARPTDSPAAIEHLRSFCRTVDTVPMRRSRTRDAVHLLRSLGSPTPFLIARDWAPEMARRVDDRAGGERFDAVHADQLWMAPYALRAQRAASGRRPRLVLDQHNAVFQIPRRLAQHERQPLKRALLRLEARKLARYERWTCQLFDQVVWVTDEDRAAVWGQASAGPNGAAVAARSSVIPICADPAAQAALQRRSDARRVTFLGGLHWPPNAEGVSWFAREVWPRVAEQAPEAVLTIIGKSPPAALATPRTAIEVTGYLPDPSPYLTETAVFIVPLQAGGGMRVKILDAWCWGLPVVTTRIGAEGVGVEDGQNVLLADSPDAFAQAVVRALREPGLAARLAAGGRRTVEAEYDWRRTYRAWDRVYAEAGAPSGECGSTDVELAGLASAPQGQSW